MNNSAKTNWKFIVLIVILAVLIGGGIMFVQQQQSERLAIQEQQIMMDTDKWEKYVDKDAYYSIKMPPEWILEKHKNSVMQFENIEMNSYFLIDISGVDKKARERLEDFDIIRAAAGPGIPKEEIVKIADVNLNEGRGVVALVPTSDEISKKYVYVAYAIQKDCIAYNILLGRKPLKERTGIQKEVLESYEDVFVAIVESIEFNPPENLLSEMCDN